MENEGEIMEIEGEMMENGGEISEKKGKMLGYEGETLADGGAKVKIESDLLNKDEERRYFESERDPSQEENRENYPLQNMEDIENEVEKIAGIETDPLVKTEREIKDTETDLLAKTEKDIWVKIEREEEHIVDTGTEKDILVKMEREVEHIVGIDTDPFFKTEKEAQHIAGTGIEKYPLVKTESEDPYRHTESTSNDPQLQVESTERDPWVKMESGEKDPQMDTENDPLVKTECEEMDPLVNNPNVSDNSVKCGATTKDPSAGKAVSRWMFQAMVLDYENNGRQVLESDGVETYIEESKGDSIVEEEDVKICPSSESDACYPNFRDNTKEDNVNNCPWTESDASYSNLEESRDESGSVNSASPPDFKEAESNLSNDTPTRQAIHLRNRPGKNSDKLIKNSSSHLRNKVGKQTATDTALKFTCRKCTSSFPSKKELTKHLQIHVQLDTRTNLNYSEIFVKERSKFFRRRKEELKTKRLEAVQESSSSHKNIPQKNKLAENCDSQDRRIKDGTHPTLKRHKKIDYVVEIVCRDCGESFRQGDLEKHSTVCVALEKYECAKCDLKFKLKSSYEKHIEIHKYSVNTYISAQDQVTRSSDHSSTKDQVQRSSKHGSKEVRHSSNCISVVDQLQGSNSHSSVLDLVQRSGNPSSTVDREQESNNPSKEKQACKIMNEKKTEAQYNRVTIVKPKGTIRGMYMCTTCKRELFGLAKVLAHTSVHFGNEWYTQYLENPNEIINLANSFHCRLCTKYFAKTYEAVHYHFECQTCREHFVDKADVNTHQESHNADISYLVTQVVSPWVPIKRPEVRSLAPPRLECQECHEVFDQRPLLASHSVTAHPSKFRWIEENKIKNVMFKCVECNLNVLCQAAYFGHLLAHSK